MWSVYAELCDLGANIDAERFFGAETFFEQGNVALSISIQWHG